MTDYNSTFEKIAEVLEVRAIELGASGFSLGDAVFPLEVALDESGPITWALILHAEALTRVTGIARPLVNALPVICISNPDTPWGNQAVVTKGIMPMAMAMNFLDAALEHAINVGMLHCNYTQEEWAALPFEQRVIPIEPYFEDLKENWVTDAIENGTLAERAQSLPTLLDKVNTTARLQHQNAAERSSILNFPSAS